MRPQRLRPSESRLQSPGQESEELGAENLKAAREPRSGKLVQRRDLTSTLAIFRFELDGGVPDFEAGQFIMLGLQPSSGQAVWRAYSIASPPEVKDHVEIYVRLTQGPHRGHFTSALWRMGTGDTLLWKPPRGKFIIADRMPDGSPDDRPLLHLKTVG